MPTTGTGLSMASADPAILFWCTVPELPGATGFPVNPVCLF